MPVKKDASGRRSVELEFELPGTPEQVWQAIATGPGITAWFVPAKVEERLGGAVAFQMGGGMESSGHVTAWEPPHRFAYEEPGWSGDAPPLASEFIVEARSGGSCTVRLVHSLFTARDDWDDQLEGMETGWTAFFPVLAVYLAHFPGQRAASTGAMGGFPGSYDDAWETVSRALNISGARVGDTRDTAAGGGPSLVGIVQRVSANPRHREVMLRLGQPAPGVALIGTHVWQEKVRVAISLYFYGEDAEAVAARQEPVWQAWIAEHFSPDA